MFGKDISDEQIEEIILNISKMYRLGNTFIGATFSMLEEYGVEVTEDNMQEILNYLIDIYNNTRIWNNNGWTPIEMLKNAEIDEAKEETIREGVKEGKEEEKKYNIHISMDI